MVQTAGPGDYHIDGHILRVDAGLIVTFPDYAVAEPTDDYDAYDTRVAEESDKEEPQFFGIGEEKDAQYSQLRSNPWQPSESGEYWAEASDAAMPWEPNIQIVTGNVYSYDGQSYICIQGHVSQVDWTPDATGILGVLYTLIAADNVWRAGVAYAVDDEVTYEDVLYNCIQAHTSQVGWEPPNVPALWQVVT